jgi:hypothetical protein
MECHERNACMKMLLLCALYRYGFNKGVLSCGQLLIFWESAESNPGYVRDNCYVYNVFRRQVC